MQSLCQYLILFLKTECYKKIIILFIQKNEKGGIYFPWKGRVYQRAPVVGKTMFRENAEISFIFHHDII